MKLIYHPIRIGPGKAMLLQRLHLKVQSEFLYIVLRIFQVYQNVCLPALPNPSSVNANMTSFSFNDLTNKTYLLIENQS